MKAINQFYPNLKAIYKAVITMHQKPDGDALGSTLGLMHFLKKLGWKVTVISPTNWAAFLDWIPGCDEVWDYEANVKECTDIINEADILFSLDYNAMHRTKNMQKVLADAECIKVLIDHHEQPEEEMFDFGVSNTMKSSTAEMVYDFIVDAGYSDLIDKQIATCLYTGMMTDTGSFRFPSTTASVHQVVTHFKQIGLNHTAIHEAIYDSFSETRLRFLGNALLNRMEVFPHLHSALMSIPKSDLIKFNTKTGDTEGLVNYMLSLNGIRFAAICIDRDEERKWSFRSKGDFDVNQFARLHFDGGGHKNAAGGHTSETLEEATRRFKKILNDYSEELSPEYINQI